VEASSLRKIISRLKAENVRLRELVVLPSAAEDELVEEESRVTRLRVMTFNIANAIDTEDDGDNVCERRAPLNVATIKRYAPDAIGFQQCDEGNLATYRADLAAYRYVLGPAADGPDLYDYNAIAYAPDRLELLDAGGFYLSGPEGPAPSGLGMNGPVKSPRHDALLPASYCSRPGASWRGVRLLEAPGFSRGEMSPQRDTGELVPGLGRRVRQGTHLGALPRAPGWRGVRAPQHPPGPYR
jgi:hypothetical protein